MVTQTINGSAGYYTLIAQISLSGGQAFTISESITSTENAPVLRGALFSVANVITSADTVFQMVRGTVFSILDSISSSEVMTT